MKLFKLEFRWRTATNQLEGAYEDCLANSQKEARQVGNRLAQERAQSHAGKYWFMRLRLPDGREV